MKLPMSLQGAFCSPVCLTRADPGGLKAEHETEDLHSETGSRIDLGPNLTAKTRLLSFNRTQSRVVTGLPTGHNTLRRHLYIMGLIDNPLCRKCGAEEETSAHV
jgi:hypothetical protein